MESGKLGFFESAPCTAPSMVMSHTVQATSTRLVAYNGLASFNQMVQLKHPVPTNGLKPKSSPLTFPMKHDWKSCKVDKTHRFHQRFLEIPEEFHGFFVRIRLNSFSSLSPDVGISSPSTNTRFSDEPWLAPTLERCLTWCRQLIPAFFPGKAHPARAGLFFRSNNIALWALIFLKPI
ncbi:hypothetical protein FF1_006792 [Malus domestica]